MQTAIKSYKMRQVITGLVLFILTASCNNKVQQALSKEFIDAGPNFSKAVSIRTGNVKTIYVTGLTGEGADFELQTRSTFENIRVVLEKAGAGLKDIVKTNIYIPNYTPANMDIFREIRKEILGGKDMPASTVIGVSVLAAKDKLMEIEAVAVVQLN